MDIAVCAKIFLGLWCCCFGDGQEGRLTCKNMFCKFHKFGCGRIGLA